MAFKNIFLRSYTKRELRHLCIDPNYDLRKLYAALPPDDIKPLSKGELLTFALNLIDDGDLPITEANYKKLDRLPSDVCEKILLRFHCTAISAEMSEAKTG